MQATTPSKMQSLRHLFSMPDKRPQDKLTKRGAPAPLDLLAPRSAGRGFDGAGEVTPTLARMQGVQLSHERPTTGQTPPTPPRKPLYVQTSASKSQPNLTTPPQEMWSPVAPSRAPQPSHRTREAPSLRHNKSSEAAPLMMPSSWRDAAVKEAELRDEVRELPSSLRHRRNDSGYLSSDGSVIYAADYSSNATTTSGFLSRGTSTNSTARTHSRTKIQEVQLSAFGVQQDFFLAAMALNPAQRAQLLVSVPERIVDLYHELYAMDFVPEGLATGFEPPQQSLLQMERVAARMGEGVSREAQDAILKACNAVVSVPSGDKSLCRVLRWLLQPTIEEQRFGPSGALDKISALSGQQMSALLEPLHLQPTQAARLAKHCRAVPHQVDGRLGYGSLFSYQFP